MQAKADDQVSSKKPTPSSSSSVGESAAAHSFSFALPGLGGKGAGVERGVQCVVSLHKYTLRLRSAFGTSHSSTTSRANALLTVSLTDANTPQLNDDNASQKGSRSGHSKGSGPSIVGYGEIGLPPKKAGCYVADFADVEVNAHDRCFATCCCRCCCCCC